MTDNTRTPRAAKDRSTEERRKPWAPPSRLDAPPPPEGYVHRWVRTAIRNEEDTMNVHTRCEKDGNRFAPMSTQATSTQFFRKANMRALLDKVV